MIFGESMHATMVNAKWETKFEELSIYEKRN
jgi:hypothetical protein